MMYLYLFIGLAIYRGLITYKFYEAAGRKAWEAFIPFYNVWVLLKITDRPWWYILIYYVPVVDNVMAIVMAYELLHVFKLREVKHTVYTVLTLGLYLGYLNYTQKLNYVGRDNTWIKKYLGGFTNAVFFAIIAATLIRSTTFESYTIPTGSMESSLLVGDFLFVNKMEYGVRLPITPLTVPLVHNLIPGTTLPSYSSIVELPYIRLPRFNSIANNDPVVFNYPADVGRPIDKKDNYVKRCIAVAGDTLLIDDGVVYINGEENTLPERAKKQFSYMVTFQPGQGPNPQTFKTKFDIDIAYSTDALGQIQGDAIQLQDGRWLMFIPDQYVEEIRAFSQVLSVERNITKVTDENRKEMATDPTVMRLFPNMKEHGSSDYVWSLDDYGPIWIPQAGTEVTLDDSTIQMYSTLISRYEGHDLDITEDGIYIDGEKTNTYTIEQDYYWMMGDNRHNSADSRFWGFVPEDHIVGKPVFIWMSLDAYSSGFDKLRTDRIFTTVNGDGERVSYFWYFIAVVGVYQVISYFRKKKKGKAA